MNNLCGISKELKYQFYVETHLPSLSHLSNEEKIKVGERVSKTVQNCSEIYVDNILDKVLKIKGLTREQGEQVKALYSHKKKYE